MTRLAIWTAENDFRGSCKSEIEAGLPRTAACNRTLEQPLQPPPTRKHLTGVKGWNQISCPSLGYLVTPYVLLLLACNAWKRSVQHYRKSSVETNKTQVEAYTLPRDTSSVCLGSAAASVATVKADTLLDERTVPTHEMVSLNATAPYSPAALRHYLLKTARYLRQTLAGYRPYRYISQLSVEAWIGIYSIVTSPITMEILGIVLAVAFSLLSPSWLNTIIEEALGIAT